MFTKTIKKKKKVALSISRHKENLNNQIKLHVIISHVRVSE